MKRRALVGGRALLVLHVCGQCLGKWYYVHLEPLDVNSGLPSLNDVRPSVYWQPGEEALNWSLYSLWEALRRLFCSKS
jgi:hypothetical protein